MKIFKAHHCRNVNKVACLYFQVSTIRAPPRGPWEGGGGGAINIRICFPHFLTRFVKCILLCNPMTGTQTNNNVTL